MDIEKIKETFRGDIIGKEIIFFQSTTSTNDKAIEIGQEAEDPEGIVVIADTQECGRGRFDRSWVSPPGVNLYFTILLKPPFYVRDASLLTLMSAVATVSGIRESTGLDARIKWPNDIFIGDKKVGGILAEMKTDRGRIMFVAVGIGLNVNLFVNILPENIKVFATSLMKEKGELIDRVKLLGDILNHLDYWYKVLLSGDKGTLIEEWLRLNFTTGNKVIVQTRNSIISGIAEGIDEDGALIVRRASGVIEKVYAGEVTILKR